MVKLPNGLISFGKNANCTLELCPLESSILQYQPSIPGNGVIIGAFALAMFIHIFQGFRWRSWDFMICMIIGCLDEIIGYVGRILLHSNPFSFNGFLIQIGTPPLDALSHLLWKASGLTGRDSLHHHGACVFLLGHLCPADKDVSAASPPSPCLHPR